MDRSAKITIGGAEYELLLTTRATREIGARYGGIAKLGEKFMQTENFELALSEIIWLITLLANQPIMIHNLLNTDQKELLREEAVELLTTPLELTEYKNAIMDAMRLGVKRNIQSEGEDADASKNE